MRLRTLSLRHFRNVALARLEFSGRLVFCVGANAQGKTNLLEAAGLLTALRSFRTPDNRLLLMHNQPAAALVCELEHERHGPAKVSITLRREGKEVWCDDTRVTRLADFIGRFPTVAFSSQDQQLVRGSPAGRRRWLGSRSSGVIRPSSSRSASQVRLWVQSSGTFSLATRGWLPGS